MSLEQVLGPKAVIQQALYIGLGQEASHRSEAGLCIGGMQENTQGFKKPFVPKVAQSGLSPSLIEQLVFVQCEAGHAHELSTAKH